METLRCAHLEQEHDDVGGDGHVVEQDGIPTGDVHSREEAEQDGNQDKGKSQPKEKESAANISFIFSLYKFLSRFAAKSSALIESPNASAYISRAIAPSS